MKFDLGVFQFESMPEEPVLPVMFSVLSVADTQEALSAGPTMAKSKPVTHRRSLTIAFSWPQDGETGEASVARVMNEVVKRSTGKVRKQDGRPGKQGPGALAEISHRQGQTALRSLVYVTPTGRGIVTAMHTGLDIKTNEKAMYDQIDSVIKSLQAA